MIASATHNIWAIKCVTQEAYDDDGEHGAGFRLMEKLKELQLNNVMIIVTRWYGGTNMGPQRFTSIIKAAMAALTHAHIIQPEQKQEIVETLLMKKATKPFDAQTERRATEMLGIVTEDKSIFSQSPDTISNIFPSNENKEAEIKDSGQQNGQNKDAE